MLRTSEFQFSKALECSSRRLEEEDQEGCSWRFYWQPERTDGAFERKRGQIATDNFSADRMSPHDFSGHFWCSTVQKAFAYLRSKVAWPNREKTKYTFYLFPQMYCVPLRSCICKSRHTRLEEWGTPCVPGPLPPHDGSRECTAEAVTAGEV